MWVNNLNEVINLYDFIGNYSNLFWDSFFENITFLSWFDNYIFNHYCWQVSGSFCELTSFWEFLRYFVFWFFINSWDIFTKYYSTTIEFTKNWFPTLISFWLFLWVLVWNFVLFFTWIWIKKFFEVLKFKNIFKNQVLFSISNFLAYIFWAFWIAWIIVFPFFVRILSIQESHFFANCISILLFFSAIFFFIFRKIFANESKSNLIIDWIFLRIFPFLWLLSNFFVAFSKEKFKIKLFFILIWAIFNYFICFLFFNFLRWFDLVKLKFINLELLENNSEMVFQLNDFRSLSLIALFIILSWVYLIFLKNKKD